MNSDQKIALYFLSLHVSQGRSPVNHAERHLNECYLTVVENVEVTEALAVDHNTVPNTYVSAHLHCRHGWSLAFEHNRFGHADGYRAAADSLIED